MTQALALAFVLVGVYALCCRMLKMFWGFDEHWPYGESRRRDRKRWRKR